MADTSRNIENREFILLLISLYRDRPELWKIKSKDYSNKDKKCLAVRSIVNVLKTYKPGFDEEKFKKKINVLRTNFNKEYQKIEKAKRSGASSHDIPEPTLWYYYDFLFIKDRLDVAESEASEQSLTEEPLSAKRPAPFVKKKKTTPDSTQTLADLAIAYFKKPSDNESDILAKGWAMKLNRISPDQRRYAEKIINDTLFEAEMGTLTRHGVRFLPSLAPSVSPAPSISPAPYSSPASCSTTRSQPFYISPESNPDQPIQIHTPNSPSTSSSTTTSALHNDESTKELNCVKKLRRV